MNACRIDEGIDAEGLRSMSDDGGGDNGVNEWLCLVVLECRLTGEATRA